MKLVFPSLRYKSQYLNALEETLGETGETQLNRPEPHQTFEEFVTRWKDTRNGNNSGEGKVPSSMYWLIDHGEFIGRVDIRHELNDFLFNYGGHIGYYIKPSKRKMGYGRKILELGIVKAKAIGLTKVLVTCDDANIGSQKIIESSGGVLENIVEQEKGKTRKKRYWIHIGK